MKLSNKILMRPCLRVRSFFLRIDDTFDDRYFDDTVESLILLRLRDSCLPFKSPSRYLLPSRKPLFLRVSAFLFSSDRAEIDDT